MGRTSAVVSRRNFVVDESTLVRSPGYTVDYSLVTAMGGKKYIKPGTVVILTSGGQIAPRVNRPGTETSYGILETYAEEGNLLHASTGYSVLIGGAFYEDQLEEATGSPKVIPSAYKTELIASGGGFRFIQS